MECWRFAEGAHQGSDILALVRAGQGQNHGLGRISQETSQFGGNGGVLLAAIGRHEAFQVRAGRDDPHLLGLVVVIQPVLLLDLVGGGGNHQGGRAEGQLLRFDAPSHVVSGLDHVALDARGDETATLHPAQGMAGMYQRHTQQMGQPGSHIAGIGIVAVDEVRHPPPTAQKGQGVVGERVQMVPQLLLADVAFGPGVDAHDAGLGAHGLDRLGVVRTHQRIHHAPGHQIHLCHTGQFRQIAGHFRHVQGLPTGIRIPAQLQIMATDQTMHAQHQYIDRGHAACPSAECHAVMKGR